MNSETSAENFPYLVYRHAYYGKPQNPREEHLAWNGIVLPKNHSFWETHFPPNGFNCHCGVQQLTAKEAQREMIKSGKNEKAFEEYAKTLKEDDEKLEKSGWAYNPGIDDKKGIRSLFEHIQNVISSDKYSENQKEIAQKTISFLFPSK